MPSDYSSNTIIYRRCLYQVSREPSLNPPPPPTHDTHHMLDCKTVGFFLKISKEIGEAWRKSLTRAKRASLTRL